MTAPCWVDGFDTLILLFCLIIQFEHVSLFSMLSRGEVHVLSAGDQVSLDCEFYKEDFSLFDNPVLWQKIQYYESSEINIMGYVKGPFESTGKFEVSYDPRPPRYKLGLKITNLSLEDSGNYSCEVRAPKSALLGHVTHRLFIKAPVIDVAIVQGNATLLPDNHDRSARTLSFVENTPRTISCIGRGGNPPPDVHISIGHMDVTDRFHMQTYPHLSGAKGFRLMQTTTIMRSDRFMVGPMDDTKRLKCRMEVAGVGSQTAAAHIEVNYKPMIFCDTAAAYLGDKNVHLYCKVVARPGVEVLFWMLDSNGTVVSEGDVVNEYWVVNRIEDDGGVETKLFLHTVRPESFRTYTLVAENSVATTTRTIELRQLRREPPPNSQTVVGQEQKSHPISDDNTRRYNGYVFPESRGSYNGAQEIPLAICMILISLLSL